MFLSGISFTSSTTKESFMLPMGHCCGIPLISMTTVVIKSVAPFVRLSVVIVSVKFCGSLFLIYTG